MTETNPNPATLAALLLAAAMLPPLVAALLGGPAEAPASHATFCADAPVAPAIAKARPAATPPAEPVLACGAAAVAVAR